MKISSAKLKNLINKEAFAKGISVSYFLKNIRVNGVLKGCSGFVQNKTTGSIIYINTEGSAYGDLSGKVMLRYAADLKDYSSNGITNGQNQWVPAMYAGNKAIFMLTSGKASFPKVVGG